MTGFVWDQPHYICLFKIPLLSFLWLPKPNIFYLYTLPPVSHGGLVLKSLPIKPLRILLFPHGFSLQSLSSPTRRRWPHRWPHWWEHSSSKPCLRPAGDSEQVTHKVHTNTDTDCLIFCLLLPKPPLPVLYIYIITLIKKTGVRIPQPVTVWTFPKWHRMKDEGVQAQLRAVAQPCWDTPGSVQRWCEVWTELAFLMSAITTGKCLPLPWNRYSFMWQQL